VTSGVRRAGTLDHVLGQIQRGQLDGAIESLRHLLSDEPNSAPAHALLALCLVDTKRLHAALHEAQVALSLAPTSPFAHLAAGSVNLARGRFASAGEHLQSARELDPTAPAPLRALARLARARGRRDQVLPLLEEALALNPGEIETIVDLGEHYLAVGALDQAEERARAVLQMSPGALDGVVLMGNVLLQRGRVAEARDHALWALSSRATDPGALMLLTAVKARQSPFLGLWWRWNTWMGALGHGKQIVVLLGTFVVYRVATIALTQGSHSDAASALQTLWLAICAYSWVTPALFARMLRRELEQVRLRRDF
jgi:tetratricopeptide (TPR) repeat protein